MSTAIHDFPNATVLAVACPPSVLTDGLEGDSIDLGAGDGPCFVVQCIGAVSGTTPEFTSRLEISPDNISWTTFEDVEFEDVTESDSLQLLKFERPTRYIRWVCELTGTTPSAAVAAWIGQQKKTM